MGQWLLDVDDSDTLAVWHQRAALQLVGRGFHYPARLDGLSATTAVKFAQCDKGKALLKRAVAVDVATTQASRKRARRE